MHLKETILTIIRGFFLQRDILFFGCLSEVFFILVIDIKNLSKEFGERKLFAIPSLAVYSGAKIGIVGENGAGKTTLLGIIAKQISPTEGRVEVNGHLSYITQSATERPSRDGMREKYQWLVPDIPKSGGEIMRAKIAEALAENSDILICDEPTSNLDEAGIRQLENVLNGLKTTVLMVSHDRELMDKVCSEIWEIKDGEVRVFSGNYSAFKAQQAKERQNQQKEYDKYIRTKQSLEQAAADRTRKAYGMTKTPTRMGNSEARLHRMDVRQRAGKVSARAGNIQSRIDKLEAKQEVKAETHYKFSANHDGRKAGKYAVVVEDLCFAYGQREVLKHVSFRVQTGERICVTGVNGSGKSTLLSCIVQGKAGIRVSPALDIGYFDQNCQILNEDDSILSYVMRQSQLPEHMTRTVLAEFGIRRDDVYKHIRSPVRRGKEQNGFGRAAVSSVRDTGDG